MSSLTDTNDAHRGDAHRYDADSAVLGIFLFTTLVLGLAQAYLFAHLLGAPFAALAPVLVSRAAQGLVLIAVRAATATPWYASRRTEALCAAFALLSAFQLDCNRRILILSAEAHPMAQALVATCVALALAFHAALPLVKGRVAPDLSAYALTALAHAAFAPLEGDAAVRFAGTLGLGFVVAALLRVSVWCAGLLDASRPSDAPAADASAPSAAALSAAAFDAVLEIARGVCLVAYDVHGAPIVTRASADCATLLGERLRFGDATFLPSLLSADELAMLTEVDFECVILRGTRRLRGRAIVGGCVLCIEAASGDVPSGACRAEQETQPGAPDARGAAMRRSGAASATAPPERHVRRTAWPRGDMAPSEAVPLAHWASRTELSRRTVVTTEEGRVFQRSGLMWVSPLVDRKHHVSSRSVSFLSSSQTGQTFRTLSHETMCQCPVCMSS